MNLFATKSGNRLNLQAMRYSPEVAAAKTAAIYAEVLRESRRIRDGNFTAIETSDLARMFGLYDEAFFGGRLKQGVAEQSDGPLRFRLSSRMTFAGGKMIRTRVSPRPGERKTFFEIAVSTRLLFTSFADVQRPVMACGMNCADRLQSLQRIMEHEIIHLAEMLAFGKSSCSAARFKTLAFNIFAHTDTTHNLVTPRERAAVRHAIVPGSLVQFEFDGIKHIGRVNRIGQRATVLVEDDTGIRYTDGKHYQKYYIPVPMLRRVNPG